MSDEKNLERYYELRAAAKSYTAALKEASDMAAKLIGAAEKHKDANMVETAVAMQLMSVMTANGQIQDALLTPERMAEIQKSVGSNVAENAPWKV